MAELRSINPSQNAPQLVEAGGGGNNGGMEARIAKLESSMEHVQADIGDLKDDVRDLRKEMVGKSDSIRADMRADFRLIFGAIITLGIALSGLMAHGFHWL